MGDVLACNSQGQQLGHEVMMPVKGTIISKNGVCPSMQLVGSTTRLKGNKVYWKVYWSQRRKVCPNMQLIGLIIKSRGNKACERSNDLKEGGMPQYATHRVNN